LAKGKTEGRAEGKAEGRREGWIGSIISILRARFGNLEVDDLVAQLQSLDDAKLSRLVVDTISVETLEAFKKLLEKTQEQPENGKETI
jgi:hypothetical protein